ncbi:MAG: DUF456 domain-containing protein [Patescibacteria group bacterium]|jgi:uncharacterized protein YqgC (DUF456 family)
MELALTILATVLVGFGLMGTVIPALPGLPLIFVGFLVRAAATGLTEPSPLTLVLVGLATALYYVLHLAAAPVATKAFGGTAWGATGALLGLIVGILFFPAGFVSILIAPLLGAVAGELLAGRTKQQALKSGLGATLSFLVSTAIELGLGLGFATYFIYLLVI